MTQVTYCYLKLVWYFKKLSLYFKNNGKMILEFAQRATQLLFCVHIVQMSYFQMQYCMPHPETSPAEIVAIYRFLCARSSRLWPILEKVNGRVAQALSHGNSHPSLPSLHIKEHLPICTNSTARKKMPVMINMLLLQYYFLFWEFLVRSTFSYFDF